MLCKKKNLICCVNTSILVCRILQIICELQTICKKRYVRILDILQISALPVSDLDAVTANKSNLLD